MNSTLTESLPFNWKDALLEFIVIGPLAGALYLLLGGDVSAFAVTMPAAALVLTWGLATRRYHYIPGADEEIPQNHHRRSEDRESQGAKEAPLPAFVETPQQRPADVVAPAQKKVAAAPVPKEASLKEADKRSLVEEVFGDPCPYCGTTLNANNARLDYMDPLSRGGREEARNVSVCCNTCESKKTDRSFADWLNSLEEPYLTIAWDLYQSRKRGE
jgi:hypothetical protein